FNFLMEGIFVYLLPISLFTRFLAGACAVCEMDFKKVVAISTLSQLGFMIFSISSGLWLLGFLHIIFHAFFKSSLFLSTGNLIHYLLGDQDSRNFGSLGSSFFSKMIFSISNLSLMGFPFSLGFYSKDTIIGILLFDNFSYISFLFLLRCCFTVAYRFRLIFMGFIMFSSFFCLLWFVVVFYFFYLFLFFFFLCFYSYDIIFVFLLFYYFSFFSFLFLLRCCFTVAYRFRLIFMGFIMFPSFSCRLRFVEDTYFYYPILFLYVTCVFFGNFFFFF